VSALASRAFVVALVLLTASQALACAVCGGAKSDNDWMFGLTTLILSISPPVLFGVAIFFIVRAQRKSARDAALLPPAE